MLAEWAFMDAFKTAAPDTGSMLLFAELSYVGVVATPPLWLLFTLAYGRRSHWLTPSMRVLLFVIPAITLVMIATNDYHGLMWSSITPVSSPQGADLVLTLGTWFLLHAAYSYALLLAGMILLARELLHSYKKYRTQTAILLLGMIIPLAGNFINMTGPYMLRTIDLTAIAFCITGILFAWGIFWYRLFDIMPVARETLINNMADGVLILDSDDTIIDMNPAARKMLGAGESVIGQSIGAVMSQYPSLVECCRNNSHGSQEVMINDTNGSKWIDVRVSALSDEREWPYGKVVALWDVTGRKRIEVELQRNYDELKRRELELRESEDRWRRLIELNPASIAIHIDGKIVYANRAGISQMGATREEELIGQPVFKFLHPDYHGQVSARIQRMLETGVHVEPMEAKITRLDGGIIDVEMTGMPIPYLGKKAILTVIWDINDRKLAGKHLEASLREKELLLKEIHHRVKNNLQIVSSLLSLQTAATMNEEASAMMIESQNRIKSMALIHEKLYQSSDFTHIDFKDYIDSLIGSLSRTYVTAGGVRIVNSIEDVSLDIDQAIPCGLIINELITNSLKYAFAGTTGQELRVALSYASGIYTLIVSDDGPGLPPGLDFRNTSTLGLQLVVTLTAQLNGEIELLAGKGTTFRITFRKDPHNSNLAPAGFKGSVKARRLLPD